MQLNKKLESSMQNPPLPLPPAENEIRNKFRENACFGDKNQLYC
jgi:hypothetical protein